MQARNREIVIHFSGISLVADANAMVASPMYVDVRDDGERDDESSGKGGLSKVGVGFIAVFCTLVAVVAGFVAFKVRSIGAGNENDHRVNQTNVKCSVNSKAGDLSNMSISQ